MCPAGGFRKLGLEQAFTGLGEPVSAGDFVFRAVQIAKEPAHFFYRPDKTIYFKNVVNAYRIGCMQFSTNKTKRTRKSAEESAAASLEGSAARVEENAKPRQKRAAEKSAEPPVMTNHRKATKKADPQTPPAVEPVIARQPVTTGAFINDRIVKHEDIARLAYSYWEGRGYQDGRPEEDWLRAERELQRS
jgi:hypothetical protein